MGNSQFTNFNELFREIFEICLQIGRDMLRDALSQLDDALMASRDTERYRCKGYRKTCIKTLLGAVEYKRRVYEDMAAVESTKYVYLLDEELNIDRIGLLSSDVCQLAATAVCETSYRKAGELISQATGLSISHQSLWNMIQDLGKQQGEIVERHTELSRQHKGTGTLETKILFEENDGIWLPLQRESRKKFGKSKEMKVGIAYDGVKQVQSGSARRTLDKKVAYASFEQAGEFRKHKEGLVASRFNVDEIQMRIYNGDGANWIRNKNTETTIDVLDEFHRNKKITECVRDPEFAALLRKLLSDKDIPALLTCIEAQINSLPDTSEDREKLKELLKYYTENKASLLGYRDRGIAIPETREPGVIHHANLGSMESNVFTLIGNRMKGRRACWSINGANNLALILCLRNTVGFDNLFAELPQIPAEEQTRVDSVPVYGASKIPTVEGHGYEYPYRLTASQAPGWLAGFLKNISKS